MISHKAACPSAELLKFPGSRRCQQLSGKQAAKNELDSRKLAHPRSTAFPGRYRAASLINESAMLFTNVKKAEQVNLEIQLPTAT